MLRLAGFESAVVRPGRRDENDLLLSTGHHSVDQVRAHRDRFATEFDGFRDSLTMNSTLPLEAYRVSDRVAWDLFHFYCQDPVDDETHSVDAVTALMDSHRRGDWVLPVNEPSVEFLNHRPRGYMVELGLRCLDRLRDCGHLRTVTCDPVHWASEEEFQATDALVAGGQVDVVGVNYYPQYAGRHLSDVLIAAARRYPRHAVAVTETGFHRGNPANQRLHPWVTGPREWMGYVEDEVHKSRVDVEFTCYYPVLDMPSWDLPTDEASRETWSSGWV